MLYACVQRFVTVVFWEKKIRTKQALSLFLPKINGRAREIMRGKKTSSLLFTCTWCYCTCRALEPCLDTKFDHQIYYAKFLFPVTLKCRHVYEVLNIDEIKI
jgi:hypothetical protein